jgi:hypothetical protein
MNILFLEPNISKASPLITISNALKSIGVTSEFIDPKMVSTKQLIKYYLRNDLIIIQYYSEIPEYTKRQFAIATLLGVPVVRNWAGSDSLNSISKPDVKIATTSTDKLIAENISTTHQGIINELLSIGLDCKLLPQVIDNKIDTKTISQKFVNNGILTYLPSSRREFYGAKYIEHLIKKHPEIVFYIIADDEHYFAHYPNVESLGWVENLDEVWDKIGLLVRMTVHDGYPRMFLEALARSKYILHNNAFPGVWLATNERELSQRVMDYTEKQTSNQTGVEIYEQLVSAKPEQVIFDHLLTIVAPFKKWKNALLFIIKYHSKSILGR